MSAGPHLALALIGAVHLREGCGLASRPRRAQDAGRRERRGGGEVQEESGAGILDGTVPPPCHGAEKAGEEREGQGGQEALEAPCWRRSTGARCWGLYGDPKLPYYRDPLPC